MPISIRRLIEIPNLKLRLFAGSGGMDREIRWAHASELPDPSEWLEPGALVMTTGIGLPVEPEAQGAYVERLARAGLGGLLIGEQAEERIYAPELTPRLAAVANEHSFPVLLMPYELPFADVARVVAEANHGEEHARIGQALRIYDTVRLVIGTASGRVLISRLGSVANCELHVIHPGTGAPVFADSPGSLVLPAAALDQISERLSDRSAPGPAVVRLPCERPAVALAVPASRPAALVALSRTGDPPDLFVLRHIAAVAAMEVEKLRAARESRRRLGAELLDDLIDNRYDTDVAARLLMERGLGQEPLVVAAFASAQKTGGYPDLHLRLEERSVPHLLSRRSGTFVALLPHVDHAIETLGQEVESTVGFSDPVGRATRVADAYREAVWALQGARVTGGKIVRYGDDAASPFLPHNLDESRAIVRHLLGPVLEYDTEHNTSLVASLRTYLTHNRSLKASAETLHVHKQTVIYRMRRVEELTDRRLGHMEDVVNFWLALRALDLLDQDGHESA